MDKRNIEIVLTEQRDEVLRMSKKRFVRRKEEELINLESKRAQVVIGVRRSGKSTLCLNALLRAKKKFAYVNFDDERLVNLKGEDLNTVLEVMYKIYGEFEYMFIDEIQNIDSWYLFVNRLLRQGMHIVVTGSNAKLLSGELATHLTGRHSKIELYPFSFSDYCQYHKVATKTLTTAKQGLLRASFDDYLKNGGFPELLEDNDIDGYIDMLTDNIIERDIKQRFKVRYVDTLRNLASTLLNESPSEINLSVLAKTFNVNSVHTIENYVSYIKQAYLIFGVHKYSNKSRLRLRNEKCYPVDVAMMNGRKDAFAGNNLGWRLEVIVYIELLRRSNKGHYDIYYYQGNSYETDFIVCHRNIALSAIQVCYDLSSPKTRQREINGAVEGARVTGCDDCWIITDHEREEYKHSSGMIVHIIPAYEWLTQED